MLRTVCSFSRYREPSLPEDFLSRVRANIFRPLEEDAMNVSSLGWVHISDFSDTRFSWPSIIQKGTFVALGMREDTRRVPSKYLKEKVKAAISDKHESGLPLSKADKQVIKEEVYRSLLKRAIPNTKVQLCIWNTQSGLILFTSLSEKVILKFLALFKTTFNLSPTPLFPYTVAGEGLDPQKRAKLEYLNPSLEPVHFN